MNFYALNAQRKLIFISAVAGVISVFLPWFSVGALGFIVHINGFHRWGFIAFFCFAASVVIGLTGNQAETLDKNFCWAAVISGCLSLLSVVITIISPAAVIAGAVQTEKDLGIWLALAASICIVGFAWKFKKTRHGLRNGIESREKTATPASVTKNIKLLLEIDKIGELERLSKLKENGSLTEEEYQQLKSKLL